LRAGTNKDVWAKQLKHAQDSFGPKVISSLELSDDAALNTRCIHIPMIETDRKNLHKPWDPAVTKFAEDLRGQLLQLRLDRIRSVVANPVAGSECLRLRSQDMLASLAAPLDGVENARQVLLAFFREVHDPATRDTLSPLQTAVLDSLWTVVHLPLNIPALQIAELTKYVNVSLRGAGERVPVPFNPRRVSSALSSLGFPYRVRASSGSLLSLDREAVTRIHDLQRRYGYGQPRMRTFGIPAACEFCQGSESKKIK
jgi:hypothetical protein